LLISMIFMNSESPPTNTFESRRNPRTNKMPLKSEVSYEVCHPRFDVRGCSFHMQQHKQRIAVEEYDSGHTPAQEINMIETFQSIVASKTLDPSWGEICLKTQRVMDSLWSS